ncbi:MAG: putative sugar nucleotidyl transferase [Cytophagales bacterium]|nr:putative sugar nucleotidyl transferase [Bernardetiaceae bacterium]MDW8204033.1 putative sugar nucleotidyl transferase [Cytophagales bacterium]
MFSQIIFVDLPAQHRQLLPLTATRPIAELRVGIMRIREKWLTRFPEAVLGGYISALPFQPVANDSKRSQQENLYIGGGVLPNERLLTAICQLPAEHSLWAADYLLAYRTGKVYEHWQPLVDQAAQHAIPFTHTAIVRHLTDIFRLNRQEIEADWQLISSLRPSQKITDKHTAVYGAENIFIEPGATIKAAVLNAETGVIYIGKNAIVGEGSLIRGAFALGEGAQLNMGTIIRGDTTVGEYCKVGGEISNSVFLGYSNKAHEGFIGNSVIGEYCNLGAGTTISNMKNTAGNITLWNYARNEFETLERQFCGLFLGDFCMTGIHTTFNTATVAGPGLNLFNTGLPAKFIPPFAWGTPQTLSLYRLEDLQKTIDRLRAFKNKPPLSRQEKDLLRAVFVSLHEYIISAGYEPENKS